VQLKYIFCVKYFKSLKITLQLVVFSSIWFYVSVNVFSVSLYLELPYRHRHSANTKHANMYLFLLLIKQIIGNRVLIVHQTPQLVIVIVSSEAVAYGGGGGGSSPRAHFKRGRQKVK